MSGLHLQAIDVPFDNLKCPIDYCCDTYYKDIVCALKSVSSVCVQSIPFKCLKPFWSDDLDRLNKLWIQCGKPRSGIIDTTRLKAKHDYKQVIRKAADDFEKLHADEISEHLLNSFGEHGLQFFFQIDIDLSIDDKSNYK